MPDTLFEKTIHKIESGLEPQVLERLRQISTRLNEYGVDPFGFDPDFVKLSLPVALFLYRSYFRVQAYGTQNIPPGKVLFVSNHSGQLPLDGMMIITAAFLEADPPRYLRSMVETWTASLPVISFYFPRAGQIVGTRANCVRLLEREEAILVFPEGVRGISKTFDKRYQLEEFGTGFMRIALQSGAPIVPVAVVGAEEQAPTLFHLKALARLLGLPALPVTLTFPWLGLLGLLPLPTRYRISFGKPLHFSGDPDDEDAVIEDKVAQVKGTVARMLQSSLKERQHVFW